MCVWPLQFDTAIKECNSALLEKQYVTAAQQLEKVPVEPLAVLIDALVNSRGCFSLARAALTPAVFAVPHQARSSLRSLESRKGFELKILKALGTELTVQTQNIIYHLGEEWQKLIVWKLPPSKGAHRVFFFILSVPLKCLFSPARWDMQ